jgi:hypothetical protein
MLSHLQDGDFRRQLATATSLDHIQLQQEVRRTSQRRRNKRASLTSAAESDNRIYSRPTALM